MSTSDTTPENTDTSAGSPPSLEAHHRGRSGSSHGGGGGMMTPGGGGGAGGGGVGGFDGDPLGLGIRTLLDPTMRQTTEKLWLVHESQIALATELERLISQLNHYMETTEPPVLRPTVVKLASVGKRLAAVNTSLQNIQQRVNKLFIQLSKQRAAS